MNKITSTLAGLVLVAGASVVPAFAQGSLFNSPGSAFSFTYSGFGTSSFIATSGSVGFNPVGSIASSTASFALTGTQVSGVLYQVTSLVFTPAGGVAFIEVNPLQFTVVGLSTGSLSVASVGSASDGTAFNLAAPVPEASTVVSFGVLLALGGLAVVAAKRKKMNVKTAA